MTEEHVHGQRYMTTWCIFGSRGIDREMAFERLTKFADEHGHPGELISGGAKGADTWGEQWAIAEVNTVRIRRFHPDWATHGRAAGPIRNREMAKALKESGGIGVALWDGKSPGTRDMLGVLQSMGIKGHVLLVSSSEVTRG